ncbi:carboxypeptidase B2 precursor [Silurus asotus]|uniref:Carboxypeptidase B2 n=1 Tax=Silurus asotus TaxID=30991 RepID=A0AAD5AM43_SILAS|nr:carboxypeptidase B2 precursor [Silurus asotus]
MRPLVLLAILIAFHCVLRNCFCTSEEDKVLSITAVTQEQVNLLQNISSHNEACNTVLWQPASPSHITANTPVHLYVQSSSLARVTEQLQTHGFLFRVLLENTQRLIQEQTRNDTTDPKSSGTNERYHSLEDIYHFVNKTSEDYPDMTKLILIGSSFEKNPLYVLKLSGRRGPVDKAMWMDCGIHAREWISPAFCLWFIKFALTFYKENADITTMLDKLDIYILPIMNPDGYKYTWTTNRMWRKNRASRDDSFCVGVDLNRNFDANWCTKGASSNPCSDIYCGQYPESEPEVQAVTKFLRSHKDVVKLYFSIHSYSQMLLFPYSYTHEQIPNHNELYDLVQEASSKIRRHYRNQYRFGSGAKTIYIAPGGSDDWAYDQGIKYSFTFELQDRGQYGFLLPPNLITSACNEAFAAVKTIVLRVLEKLQ